MNDDYDAIRALSELITDDPDVYKKGKQLPERFKGKKGKRGSNKPSVLAESTATHRCRNKVYRRGIVMECNKSCFKMFCENCTDALKEARNKLLGLSEAKKEPSNKPDDLEVDEDFEVHDGYDEDKGEPNDKQKRKSSLQDGPDGETGSKKSPYLKESEDKDSETQPCWVCGDQTDKHPNADGRQSMGYCGCEDKKPHTESMLREGDHDWQRTQHANGMMDYSLGGSMAGSGPADVYKCSECGKVTNRPDPHDRCGEPTDDRHNSRGRDVSKHDLDAPIGLRSGPSTKSKRVGAARDGDTFEVVGRKGRWVKLANGETVWAHGGYQFRRPSQDKWDG